MMLSSYSTALLRSSGRATLRICRNSCASSLPISQQRSFRSYINSVRRAVYEKRRVIPEKRDEKDEDYHYMELEKALVNSRKIKSSLEHAFSRIQLIWNYYKYRTADFQPTGKTHYRGREFLGPHTNEVKRARNIAERLFLVLPDGHIFRRVEVIKNPGGSNACATWDGVVILDQGMLTFAYTDDLLAFLMAHEMAHHLFLHHELKRPGWKRFVIFRCFQALFTDLTSSPSSYIEGVEYRQILKNRSLSRSCELEADSEGAMIMWRARYSWKACIIFIEQKIERAKKMGSKSKSDDKPELNTHPTWEERKENLKRCQPKSGEWDTWWKENQLAVLNRKQLLDEVKAEIEYIQKHKLQRIREANIGSRSASSLNTFKSLSKAQESSSPNMKVPLHEYQLKPKEPTNSPRI